MKRFWVHMQTVTAGGIGWGVYLDAESAAAAVSLANTYYGPDSVAVSAELDD